MAMRLNEKQQADVLQHLCTAHSVKPGFRRTTPLEYDDLGGLCELALCRAVVKFNPAHTSKKAATKGRTSSLHHYVKKMCGWTILMAAKSHRTHCRPSASIDNIDVGDGIDHQQDIENRIDNADELRPLFVGLTSHENKVIQEFYGFGERPKTLQEIAADRGCTPQSIFAAKEKALAKMRANAGAK